MSSCATLVAELGRELDGFIALLEEEASALAAAQADALPPLLGRRDGINRRLATLWRHLAASLGLAENSRFDTLREKGQQQAPEGWRDMEERLRRAEMLNRLNSRLIDEQLRRTQAAVQVLRGAAESRMLYGADGRASDFLNPNRSIDKA